MAFAGFSSFCTLVRPGRPHLAFTAILIRKLRRSIVPQRLTALPCSGCTVQHRPAAALHENPQNQPQAVVQPSPHLTPEEAVAAQLDALSRNDEPWPNHGIQMAYEWALDVGGLDPSFYFGFRKDLYHLDHFLGIFQTRLPELVNLVSYRVLTSEARQSDDEMEQTSVVVVEVEGAVPGQHACFEFHLRRKAVGPRKGALMTHALLRREGLDAS